FFRAEVSRGETSGIGPLGCSPVQGTVDWPGSMTVIATPPSLQVGRCHCRAPTRSSPLASSTPRLSSPQTLLLRPSNSMLHSRPPVLAATLLTTRQPDFRTSHAEHSLLTTWRLANQVFPYICRCISPRYLRFDPIFGTAVGRFRH